jgi:hypothetical protein
MLTKEEIIKEAIEYAKPYRGYDFAEAPKLDVERAFLAGFMLCLLEVNKSMIEASRGMMNKDDKKD